MCHIRSNHSNVTCTNLLTYSKSSDLQEHLPGLQSSQSSSHGKYLCCIEAQGWRKARVPVYVYTIPGPAPHYHPHALCTHKNTFIEYYNNNNYNYNCRYILYTHACTYIHTHNNIIYTHAHKNTNTCIHTHVVLHTCICIDASAQDI
jgi:hypothetical protein